MFRSRFFHAPTSVPARPARARRLLKRLAAALALALAVAAPQGAAAQESGDLRLAGSGGESGKGRVEIYYDGEWGMVCDDYWGMKDARVACRQLGFDGAEEAIVKLGGRSDLRFWLDNVQCSGNENRLGDCPREYNIPWGSDNCSPVSEAAGVRCITSPGVYTSRTSFTVTEDSAGTSYAVQLRKQPSGSVTVTPVDASGAITFSPVSLTFTQSNWSEPQSVTVTAVDDDAYDDHDVTVTHTVAGADYDGIDAPSITVTVHDPDTRAVEVSPTSLTVVEDEPAESYTVRLLGEPSGDVTVTPATASGAITLSPVSLTFTQSNWSEPQSVTVTAVDDDAYDDHDATVTHTVAGADYAGIVVPSVAVTVLDDDPVLTGAPDALSFDEGATGTKTYDLRLARRPVRTAEVDIEAGPHLSVHPDTVRFTTLNWNTGWTITVRQTSGQDNDAVDETTQIRHLIDGIEQSDQTVAVTIVDDDPAILTGPPSMDTVWWGTFQAGSNGGASFGYMSDLGVGYLSDTGFDYDGATREVVAIYLLPGGSLNVWLEMGAADALPGTMTLHLGGDALQLSDALHTEHAATGSTPAFHWYKWTQHGIDWDADEAMGIWLTGPVAASLPGAPTGLTATPVAGGVKLDWEAPSDDGGSAISGYQFQAHDGTNSSRFWWPTGSAATTHTDTVLSSAKSYVFRVRAVNAMGNGAESAPSASVSPLPVNHAPSGAPRVVGRAAPGAKLKTKMATVDDANGMEKAEFQYQWMQSPGPGSSPSSRGARSEVRSGAQPIPGATDKTYQVRARDLGTYVMVRVTYTDDNGFTETLESEPRLLEETLLTGWLNALPAEHDGSSAFKPRLWLSEALGAGAALPAAESFTVSGGTVGAVRRIGRNSRQWEVTIAPSGDAAVVISVPVRSDCAAAGAICAGDGRALSNAIEHTVPGPVSVSVADARVHEGVDEAMRFVAMLSRAVNRTVSVDYATADGTAHAGLDYEAASGTLSFAPGESERVVAVAVLDDLLDEGIETFTLRLANPAGAKLGDGEATGTIENSDPVPQAWLARFGRTVAEQVLDAVENRIGAAPQPGARVTLTGEQVGGAEDPEAREEAEEKARLAAYSAWLRGEAERGDGDRQRSRAVLPRDLLTGSSFALTQKADGIGGGAVSLWGRGAVSRFDGREADLSLDGEVTGALLGVDWTRERWTAGLMLSHARGEGGYRGESDGRVSATLTGLYPYGRYALNERVTVWGTAGYGAGMLVLTPEGQAALETDMELAMGAAGLRGVVVQAPTVGGPELAVKTGALAVRTSSDAVRGAPGGAGNLVAATADVTRLRLGLAGAWRGLGLGTGTLEPRLEVGVRHDGGDAETGFGLDLGGGLSWTDPASGLSAEVSGRGLLTHESAGFRERGIAGSLGWDPAPGTSRGPSLTLTRTMGVAASGGVDALLGRRTLAGLASNDGNELAGRRLDLRLGYGFGVFGDRFTGTPNVGFGLSGAGTRDYRIGWRLTSVFRGDPGFEVALDATRREPANDNAATPVEDGAMLRALIRW